MSTPALQRPPLNADQLEGVKQVSAWLIGPKKEYFLTGGPGVGKTFTTTDIVQSIPAIMNNYHNAMGKKRGIEQEIVLTSTTNKAASVLTKETGQKAMTIHSFLGVIPKVDYKTGNTKLQKKGNWRVHSNIILIIDEASMIDKALYQLLHEGTDDTCKILYIGDKNQLPPVKEKLSRAVMLAADPADHYEITTPVRNSNAPALLDLCARLRADIENETPKDQLTNWPEVPGQIEYLNGDELQTLVQNMYGPGGYVDPTDADLKGRILCYTNKAVLGYNSHIRGIRNQPDHPTPGEVLINNRIIELGRSRMISIEEEVEIKNVSGPEMVRANSHNDLSAYKLEISTPFVGSAEVYIPEHAHEYNHLAKHFKKNKDWFSFYGLQEKFVDLRDREASTVYKAQGSTYEFVIMIMNDIFSSRDVAQLRRMLYVGASRAKQKVYVYDNNIYENKRGIYR